MLHPPTRAALALRRNGLLYVSTRSVELDATVNAVAIRSM
jgi:hypothetical protein